MLIEGCSSSVSHKMAVITHLLESGPPLLRGAIFSTQIFVFPLLISTLLIFLINCFFNNFGNVFKLFMIVNSLIIRTRIIVGKSSLSFFVFFLSSDTFCCHNII